MLVWFSGTLQVPVNADYTLEIVLQPQSRMQTQSSNITVRLSKSRPECNVTVTDRVGKTKTQYQFVSEDRNINVSAFMGETLLISANCSGKD